MNGENGHHRASSHSLDQQPTDESSSVATNGESKNDKNKLTSSSTSSKKQPTLKIEIPRISSSREIRPQRAHSPYRELEQRSLLFNALGSKRDLNKSIIRIKSIELEEAVKKARKYAMEQSVRFALVKQQQQQQKAQLDLIKKQQALLLMCR
jgi:hypothetical protein